MPTPASYTRVRAGVACAMTLAACALLAHARPLEAPAVSARSLPPSHGRVLHVTALDGKGVPVTDLTSADFKIFDEGKIQPIANFNAILAPSTGKTEVPTTLILFDLLNSIPGQREFLSTLIVRALEPLASGDAVYLYLLTNYGALYPVRDLPPPQQAAGPHPGSGVAGDRGQAGPPWTRQIRLRLDQAIQNVYGFRPKDEYYPGNRFVTTIFKLGELGDQFMGIPGPKSLIWITQGTPNWMDYPLNCKDVSIRAGAETYLAGKCGSGCTSRVVGSTCIDFSPFLEHFGAKLTRSDTIFYGVKVEGAGSLPTNIRGSATDTLEQLADLSGGRLFLNNEIEGAVAQALQVARPHYELTYEAPPPNGKYHKLRVECARKGVRIAAPHGYLAD